MLCLTFVDSVSSTIKQWLREKEHHSISWCSPVYKMDRNCSHTSSFCCESYDTWHVWTTWDKTKIKTPRLTGGDTQRTKLTPGAHHYLPVDSVYGRWGCRGCRSLFSYWKDYWRQNWTWNPTDSSLSSHRQGSHERLPAGRHWFLSHLNLCYTWFVCFFNHLHCNFFSRF